MVCQSGSFRAMLAGLRDCRGESTGEQAGGAARSSSVGVITQAAAPPLHPQQPGGVAEQRGLRVPPRHQAPQLLQHLAAVWCGEAVM